MISSHLSDYTVNDICIENFYSNQVVILGQNNNTSGFVNKYNTTSKKFLWETNFPRILIDKGVLDLTSIKEDNAGVIYFSGNVSQASTTLIFIDRYQQLNSTIINGKGAFVISINSEGSFRWMNKLDSNKEVRIDSLEINIPNHYLYIGGSGNVDGSGKITYGNVEIEPTKITSAENNSGFAIVVTKVDGVFVNSCVIGVNLTGYKNYSFCQIYYFKEYIYCFINYFKTGTQDIDYSYILKLDVTLSSKFWGNLIGTGTSERLKLTGLTVGYGYVVVAGYGEHGGYPGTINNTNGFYIMKLDIDTGVVVGSKVIDNVCVYPFRIGSVDTDYNGAVYISSYVNVTGVPIDFGNGKSLTFDNNGLFVAKYNFYDNNNPICLWCSKVETSTPLANENLKIIHNVNYLFVSGHVDTSSIFYDSKGIQFSNLDQAGGFVVRYDKAFGYQDTYQISIGSDPHCYNTIGNKKDINPNNRKHHVLYNKDDIRLYGHFTGLKGGIYMDKAMFHINKSEIVINFNRKTIKSKDSKNNKDYTIYCNKLSLLQRREIPKKIFRYENTTVDKDIKPKYFISNPDYKIEIVNQHHPETIVAWIDFDLRYIHLELHNIKNGSWTGLL